MFSFSIYKCSVYLVFIKKIASTSINIWYSKKLIREIKGRVFAILYKWPALYLQFAQNEFMVTACTQLFLLYTSCMGYQITDTDAKIGSTS